MLLEKHSFLELVDCVVNIPMLQAVNNFMPLSWEAFSHTHPGASVAEYLCWSGRGSL